MKGNCILVWMSIHDTRMGRSRTTMPQNHGNGETLPRLASEEWQGCLLSQSTCWQCAKDQPQLAPLGWIQPESAPLQRPPYLEYRLLLSIQLYTRNRLSFPAAAPLHQADQILAFLYMCLFLHFLSPQLGQLQSHAAPGTPRHRLILYSLWISELSSWMISDTCLRELLHTDAPLLWFGLLRLFKISLWTLSYKWLSCFETADSLHTLNSQVLWM